MTGEIEAEWVNPRVLSALREQAGLTVEAVAAESRRLRRRGFAPVDAATLRQWEQGRADPDLEHLETLSELYHCPVGQFFLSEIPGTDVPLSFRGLAPGKEQQFSPTTRASLRRFVELAEWFVALIEEHEIDWRVNLPRPAEGEGDPAWAAALVRKGVRFSAAVRERWATPDDAFDWWRWRIEAQGVFCFELKLDPKDVRGASMWVAGRYPFVLVNRSDVEAATGRLFTLLHEYAHLLLPGRREGMACDSVGRNGGTGSETVANRFAANVLLPPDELRWRLARTEVESFRSWWSDRALRELAKPFFVSRDVIAVTLEALRLAPPGFYIKKRTQWERRYRGTRPFGRGRNPKKSERKARELGRSAVRILARLHEKNALPLLDAAEFLETKVEKLDRFLRELIAQAT